MLKLSGVIDFQSITKQFVLLSDQQLVDPAPANPALLDVLPTSEFTIKSGFP